MKRNRFIALTIVMLMLTSVISGFSGPVQVFAATSTIKLDAKRITMYPGNRHQIEATGLATEKAYDWWTGEEYSYYVADYKSSDKKVATVDGNGMITAVSVGTCKITVSSGGKSATMKVTVKESQTKLDKHEITVYTGSSREVVLSTNKTVNYYTYNVSDESGASTYGLSLDYWGYDGVYRISSDKPGVYYLDAIVVDNNNQYWSDRVKVNVVACGLSEWTYSVAKGKSIDLEFQNCTVQEIYLPKQEEFPDGIYYNWWNDGYSFSGYHNDQYITVTSDYNNDCISISGNKITALSEGQALVYVFYVTPDGEAICKNLYIYVSDPRISEEAPEYLLAGQYYGISRFVEGTTNRSSIEVESSDSSIVNVESYYNSITVEKSGDVILTFNVDGKKLNLKLSCYAPKVSEDNLVIKKGKTKNLKVTGLPEGLTPVFSTSNKSVATVTKGGKITAKKIGFAEITITAGDDITLYVSVNVAKAKAVDVIHAGEKMIGWKYSQDNRSKEGYSDCSSFAWRSYHNAGIDLAKNYAPTAADLAKWLDENGYTVSYEYLAPEQMQVGDLIFYSSGSNGRFKNIDHVSLYSGAYLYYGELSGKMIHATSPAVHVSDYCGYIPYRIVLIARPLK